jgi:hypothetical protein
MENVIDFAGVAGAIVASMGLALWIEWLSLRGLMRLMPARPGNSGGGESQRGS